jgi:chaperone modulatory protein CbpM
VISIKVLIGRCSGLERHVLERWISQDWVRPDAHDGVYAFREIDVARVRLILELRDELDVGEAALPIVLLLLDQLYDLRRQLRELGVAFTHVVPEAVQRNLATHLMGGSNK